MTSFAANLVPEIRNRPVTIIHADDFLNPSAIRHAKGPASPEGFWKDTYNYVALQDQLLRPLGPNGTGWYSPASYNPATDRTAGVDALLAPSDSPVFVEGMFLHRDELASYWDACIFLDVPFTETAGRMAVRDALPHTARAHWGAGLQVKESGSQCMDGVRVPLSALK